MTTASNASKTYALILAGGSGQRFWPVSRDRLPKQLLRLFDDRTLLEHTIARLEGIVPLENTLILTNHQQVEGVREALPNFPAENIIAEPEKRDTAPAIALAIGWVAARDPEATMMVLPSDHLIQARDEFQRALLTACAAAQNSDALVTIGIKPTWACPSYGYVERGARLDDAGEGGVPVYEVVRFREKPSSSLAEQFLEQGNFTWNAGMFFWTLSTVRANLQQHCPELAQFISELATTSDFHATVNARFPKLTKLSIDYALMEKAPKVQNVEATFDWDDVGNWTSVGAYLEKDTEGNQHNCLLSRMESTNNLVFSQSRQHIALLGVHDLMVISTPDAILVAHRSQAEAIKKLVDGLPVELR
ncbi:MAG TPA: mannose-1-phosphate guanylyltransferase [Verrucomicrobium sp.]|nr:mannose-1-phosphate guanylyltransferase [Verrucomicrobium sp.]